MRVCVYGSASDNIEEKYKQKTFELGKELAERGHSLIFGAGSEGLMGAAARGFKAGGGHVHGVIPKFFEEGGYEAIFYEADEITYTETMAERKAKMEDGCKAFIIVPGGIGTFEEFFQVFTLKQLGRHEKAITLYNIDGYYDHMIEMLKKSMDAGFINKECEKLVKSFDNPKELINYIEKYNPDDVSWELLKRN
ncbi:MAG: TIGR00730 family Rossman fold protein [Clostridia bacterium]|nr:TIGR00730 family Rossman fold protein [Clostridia bacterium]